MPERETTGAAEIASWMAKVRAAMSPDGSTVTAADIKRRSGLSGGEVRRGLTCLMRSGEVRSYESLDPTEWTYAGPRRRLRYGRIRPALSEQLAASTVEMPASEVAERVTDGERLEVWLKDRWLTVLGVDTEAPPRGALERMHQAEGKIGIYDLTLNDGWGHHTWSNANLLVRRPATSEGTGA